jgi:hypothetical protein
LVHAVPVDRVIRDGRSWLVGTASDVAWIYLWTTVDFTITSAIPPAFDAYATVVLPEHRGERRRHDQAVLALLNRQSPDQRWWLGYLDTGGDDIVFPDAQKVILYADWSYVVVRAGPEQAASWRQGDYFRERRLPDLMFPEDRSWLVSTLWDDDWTCIGGPVSLVDGSLNHPDLRSRTRRVGLAEDATPPGHQAI